MFSQTTDNQAARKMKKRHHYIPQFYLERFMDPAKKPYIWVYEKGKDTVLAVTAKNLAVEKHGYSIPRGEEGRDSETYENFLADVELRAAPVFNKIEARQLLTDEERGWFSLFVAFMITRVPHFRRNVEQVASEIIKEASMIWASHEDAFTATVQSFEQNTRRKLGVPTDELRKFVQNGRYQVKVLPHFSLGTALVALNLGLLLYRMKWLFLTGTEDYKFVTCDNPVYRLTPETRSAPFNGVGLLDPDIQLSFPLSREMALLGGWKGRERYVRSDNKHVKSITRRTVISASRYVFASIKSDTLSRLVQKYRNSAPRIVID